MSYEAGLNSRLFLLEKRMEKELENMETGTPSTRLAPLIAPQFAKKASPGPRKRTATGWR